MSGTRDLTPREREALEEAKGDVRAGDVDPDADIEDELAEITPEVTVVAENDDSSAR